MLLLYDNEKTLKDFFKFNKKNKRKQNNIIYYIKLNELEKHIFNKKERDVIIILKEQDPFLNKKIKNYNLKELWIKSQNGNFINFLDSKY